MPDGINIGNKLVPARERAEDFLLHIELGLANLDPVVPGELLQEPDPLAQKPLPIVSMRKLERSLTICAPLLEQDGSGILTLEERRNCLLKTPTEAQCRPGILLAPAVEVPKAVAPRAAQILRNL